MSISISLLPSNTDGSGSNLFYASQELPHGGQVLGGLNSSFGYGSRGTLLDVEQKRPFQFFDPNERRPLSLCLAVLAMDNDSICGEEVPSVAYEPCILAGCERPKVRPNKKHETKKDRQWHSEEDHGAGLKSMACAYLKEYIPECQHRNSPNIPISRQHLVDLHPVKVAGDFDGSIFQHNRRTLAHFSDSEAECFHLNWELDA